MRDGGHKRGGFGRIRRARCLTVGTLRAASLRKRQESLYGVQRTLSTSAVPVCPAPSTFISVQLTDSQRLVLPGVARPSQLSLPDYSVLLLVRAAHCVYLQRQLAGGGGGGEGGGGGTRLWVVWHSPRPPTSGCRASLCRLCPPQP